MESLFFLPYRAAQGEMGVMELDLTTVEHLILLTLPSVEIAPALAELVVLAAMILLLCPVALAVLEEMVAMGAETITREREQ